MSRVHLRGTDLAPGQEPVKAPARTEAPVVPPLDRRVDAAHMLALQRRHGNAAVARAVVARNKTKTPPKADPKKEFRAAIAAADYDKAALALYLADEDDVLKLLKPLSTKELTDLDAALARHATLAPFAAPMAELHRYVSFRLHAPAKSKNVKSGTIVDEGTQGATAKVEGGTASAYTDVKLKGEDASHSNFAFVYKGKHASHTRWLQFIWREILVEHPVKGNFAVDQAVSTTGGNYKLTTDPTKPEYNTDSANKQTPFYESGGYTNRTASGNTMIDEPSQYTSITDAQFDDGATKVTSRAHFVTYLVRDMDVMQRFDLTVEWVATGKASATRTQTVTASSAADKLDPGIRKVLVAQFPDFDYLP